jgi:hypothetical protein
MKGIEFSMQPAAKLQFERVVREFSRWRAVPDEDRSPAAAWWWQPAFELAGAQEEMPALFCQRLELPLSSTYAAAAKMLMAMLAEQTSLPWPDEFPRKFKKDEQQQSNSVGPPEELENSPAYPSSKLER